MAMWNVPEEIEKEVRPSNLSDEDLYFYHDQMHIFWKKIEDGHVIGWTFLEVYSLHKELVIEILRRNSQHLQPINELDNIFFATDIQELTKIVNRVKNK